MLCRALVDDNVGLVAATPHQLGRFEACTRVKRILDMTELISQELSRNGIDLLVLPGAEVRLDERIGDLVALGEVLTLANMGRHILLELPDDTFIDLEPLLVDLDAQDVEIIIAHAERNAPLLSHWAEIERWRDRGVSLQVTAGSLAGRFGPRVHDAAWQLVVEGWVAVIATDAHDCATNRPCMTEAFEMVGDALGYDVARLLCVVNPARVVEGRSLIRAPTQVGDEVE